MYENIEYKVAPLSLLLALGNGRGGGDYRGNNCKYVGSWCKTTKYITVQNEKPSEDYKEFKPNFAE